MGQLSYSSGQIGVGIWYIDTTQTVLQRSTADRWLGTIIPGHWATSTGSVHLYVRPASKFYYGPPTTRMMRGCEASQRPMRQDHRAHGHLFDSTWGHSHHLVRRKEAKKLLIALMGDAEVREPIENEY